MWEEARRGYAWGVGYVLVCVYGEGVLVFVVLFVLLIRKGG